MPQYQRLALLRPLTIHPHMQEHPLRRSATILRNRANHLLEFVTDPTAAPAPTLHRVPGASRMHAYRSRLDALDASHVISSTAGNLIRSARHPSEGAHSVLSGSVDYGDAADESGGPERLEREASSDFDDSDFQDLEEDEEEDESIRTRKGVTSLKTQPGGGRNLELLRGLAAPGPEDADVASSALSIYPSGLDLDASRSPEPAGHDGSQRALSASPSKGGTPSPAPASQALPEAPGTVPGQGAALLARRATAATHPHRRPVSSLPFMLSKRRENCADTTTPCSSETTDVLSAPASYRRPVSGSASLASDTRSHG